MNRFNRLLMISNSLLATILVLVLVSFAPSVANAGASTIVACAKKNSGALRIAYTKCTKKEISVSWAKTGPQGKAGVAGSVSPVLKDSGGATIPNVTQIGSDGEIYVLNGGRIWHLDALNGSFNGTIQLSMPALFSTNDCTGPNVTVRYKEENSIMFQTMTFTDEGSLAGVYAATSSTSTQGDVYASWVKTGFVCDIFDTGFYYPITAITPPAAYRGPLQIVGQ